MIRDILTTLGLDSQVMRALDLRRRCDVVPPAPSYSRKGKGAATCAGGARRVPYGRRAERRQTGISARQQRIRRRNAMFHGRVDTKINFRKYEAANNNQRIGRKAARFLDRNVKSGLFMSRRRAANRRVPAYARG